MTSVTVCTSKSCGRVRSGTRWNWLTPSVTGTRSSRLVNRLTAGTQCSCTLSALTSFSSAASPRENSSTISSSVTGIVASSACSPPMRTNWKRCGNAKYSCSSRKPEKPVAVTGSSASSSPKPTAPMALPGRLRTAPCKAPPAVSGRTHTPTGWPSAHSCSCQATSSAPPKCSTRSSSAIWLKSSPAVARSAMRRPPRMARDCGWVFSGRSGA
ncbi:hypothetical protein D9M68_349310 [compost metagenome]